MLFSDIWTPHGDLSSHIETNLGKLAFFHLACPAILNIKGEVTHSATKRGQSCTLQSRM